MDLPLAGGMPTVAAMKGYGQFCPVAAACEVFAERWTPLILRQLLAGARRFTEIHRGIPVISRTLLAQRLRALEDAGVVVSKPLADRRGREYDLTPSGEEFRAIVDTLGAWGQRWSGTQFRRDNLDVSFLMFAIQHGIDVPRLAAGRIVVRFDFREVAPRCRKMRTWWMVLDKPDVEVCLKDPGFDVDLVVSADAATMARFWAGHLSYEQALRSGGLSVEGPRPLVRAFPTWLLRSPYAAVLARPGERLASS